MTQRLLLVDFENVQQVDIERLDESFRVNFFVGASQKSIPVELVTAAQKLGDRVEWSRLEENGKNALDFFIAFQLGRIAEREANLECIILSRDKGYDPLLKYLNRNGLKCRRINSMMELDPNAEAESQSGDPNYDRVIELLGKLNKRSRPRRRKTLSKHIRSLFQNNIEPGEVERIVDRLFANKMISETNNAVTYEF